MVENPLCVVLSLQLGAAAGWQSPRASSKNLRSRRLARNAPLHGIDSGTADKGRFKWSGIAALGTKLFAAPFRAPVLLVVETLAGVVVRGNSTDAVHKGVLKWRGIAALGTKLFAAPDRAPVLLVVETLAGVVVRSNSTDAVHKGEHLSLIHI